MLVNYLFAHLNLYEHNLTNRNIHGEVIVHTSLL